jgi:hypothetical protein
LQLQKRARELGRIRIGQKGPKGQPQKLDRFRLTSYSRPLMEKVAALYGGEVQDWTPQGGAPAFEVITDAKRIPILVPPQPVTQWLETWTAGGCIHRCDGETEMISGEPCDLGPAHEAAKPTTRLKVVLRDVEGVGVFRLESHGWNAAAELPESALFLAAVGGYVEGWLALEERVSKNEGQTRRFIVPVIDIDVTPAQLLAGQGRVQAPAIAGPAPKAIEAGGDDARGDLPHDERKEIAEQYLARARGCDDMAGVAKLWHEAKDSGHLTNWLEGELRKIADGLKAADVEPEASVEALWQTILDLAGQQGTELLTLLDDFAKQTGGVTADNADASDMQRYLNHLRSVTA